MAENLWNEFQETRDLGIRNKLVVDNLHIVKRIVGRMASNVSSYVAYDDLMNCGVIGLIDAVEKFDVSKKVRFATYAYMRVKGEVLDYLRKLDWASNSLRHKIKRIEEGYRILEQKGEPVNDEKVAEFLHMDVDEMNKVIENSYTFNLIYIDEILGDGEIAKNGESIEEKIENSEIKQKLLDSIDHLSDKEKKIISMYYVDELTLKEIGMIMNLSESRICQIHSKAILKLRSRLSEMQ